MSNWWSNGIPLKGGFIDFLIPVSPHHRFRYPPFLPPQIIEIIHEDPPMVKEVTIKGTNTKIILKGIPTAVAEAEKKLTQ